jgi:hypothetical protein
MLVFRLGRAALVEFVIYQVAPDCRRIGRFRVAGRPGLNRVRFRGRVGRRVLAPGTYRLRARTLPRGHAVVDAKFVVVIRPERQVIASARGADACGSKLGGQSTSLTASVRGNPGAATASPARIETRKPAHSFRAQDVLGAKFAKGAVGAIESIPPLLYVLLGLAIGLLGVAALPLRMAPTRQAATTLEHHRGGVALAGAALLVAVTVAYALLF